MFGKSGKTPSRDRVRGKRRVALILEGLVTTANDDGTVNLAPMGPSVDSEITRLVLRPWQTSRTYRNLKVRGEGVFHVVDDVWLLAQAAVGPVEPPPPMLPATEIQGHVLQQACRWYEFRVVALDDRHERTRIETEVVATGRLRDFFGFNRAKHAVVEAAILATRVHLLPPDEIQEQVRRLGPLVEKTGGGQEHRAFALLVDYINRQPRQVRDGSA
jgi:hypothetical protein